ncbi:hypothetical protein NSA47_13760 [Irregularibacter muris]|uniref:Lipoprotein n=1 Tax=Irregularibacter muris TaxID=1796619 RepID=A0AAE3L004_9FIRM|nr:hypothetical protein [Irregularibacter muris]MCR1900030.1 hypothetical protein [Irregularibacter muris]
MKRCLIVIACVLFLFMGCASKEVFIESKEIKDFPIPEEAEFIETQEDDTQFQYHWENIKVSSGIPKSFQDKVKEYGWKLDEKQSKEQEYYFIKYDRTLKLLVEDGSFILSEVESLPQKRDKEGNYLLNHQIIFDGDKDDIFFENTLEQNAYDWFMDSLEKIKKATNKEQYFYKKEGNIYEYLVITGGQKVKRVYINEKKTRIVIELTEGKGTEDEIQFLRYKSFYPNIKISATILVEN